jgi:hypothetical protein
MVAYVNPWRRTWPSGPRPVECASTASRRAAPSPTPLRCGCEGEEAVVGPRAGRLPVVHRLRLFAQRGRIQSLEWETDTHRARCRRP